MPSVGPTNARVNSDGLRIYTWEDAVTGERHELLSVTSISKLAGENFQLVNWQLNNLLDTMMGTVKRQAIGKRGKPLKDKFIYVPETYPSEFVQRYLAADGSQPKITALRAWAREQADSPRNIAAIRGTIAHKAVERNLRWQQIERPWVEATFMDLSQRDRAKRPDGVLDDDVLFVRRSVANYWDMRTNVPFVIIAREPQVINLTAGYGGSADLLLWFLPKDYDGSPLPKAHELTLKLIQSIGGYTAVGDLKTSKGVFTDHVVQVHAYGAGEFVGEDGIVNRRLSDILQSTQRGVLLHVRPDKWGVHTFDFNEPTFRAFFGSLAFARFVFEHPRPYDLFIENHEGSAPEEEVA